jgi:hypothetical protein
VSPASEKDTFSEEVEDRLDDLFGDAEEVSDESIEQAAIDESVEQAAVDESVKQAAVEESVKQAKAEESVEQAVTDESAEQAVSDELNPLRDLKSTILSIDWEITDQNMAGFVEQIEQLKEHFRNDRIILMFLQLLGSLGEYIKTNKAESHPNSFKLLSSVFGRLENIAESRGLAESKKKRYLFIELNKYKQLKEEIATSKKPGIKKEKAEAEEIFELKESQKKVEDSFKEIEEEKALPKEKPEVLIPEPGQFVTAEQFTEAINEIKNIIAEEFRRLKKEIEMMRQA